MIWREFLMGLRFKGGLGLDLAVEGGWLLSEGAFVSGFSVEHAFKRKVMERRTVVEEVVGMVVSWQLKLRLD